MMAPITPSSGWDAVKSALPFRSTFRSTGLESGPGVVTPISPLGCDAILVSMFAKDPSSYSSGGRFFEDTDGVLVAECGCASSWAVSAGTHWSKSDSSCSVHPGGRFPDLVPSYGQRSIPQRLQAFLKLVGRSPSMRLAAKIGSPNRPSRIERFTSTDRLDPCGRTRWPCDVSSRDPLPICSRGWEGSARRVAHSPKMGCQPIFVSANAFLSLFL